MFPLNVFAEGHLQEGQSHVERLDDVALPGQRMVPPGRLSAWHLTLREKLLEYFTAWLEILQRLKRLRKELEWLQSQFEINRISLLINVILSYLDSLESHQHLALQSLKS